MGKEDQPRLVECSFLIPIPRDSDRLPHSPLTWSPLQKMVFSIKAGMKSREIHLHGE